MCEEKGNKENKLVLIVIVREYVIFICILFVDIECFYCKICKFFFLCIMILKLLI